MSRILFVIGAVTLVAMFLGCGGFGPANQNPEQANGDGDAEIRGLEANREAAQKAFDDNMKRLNEAQKDPQAHAAEAQRLRAKLEADHKANQVALAKRLQAINAANRKAYDAEVRRLKANYENVLRALRTEKTKFENAYQTAGTGAAQQTATIHQLRLQQAKQTSIQARVGYENQINQHMMNYKQCVFHQQQAKSGVDQLHAQIIYVEALLSSCGH